MRRSLLGLCVGIFLLIRLTATAQVSDSNKREANESLPPIVVAGLNIYKDKGPEDAVRAWIKDSPIDGSKEALSQANNLRQVQDFYGAYKTFDVVSTRDLSPRIRILYLTLDFEKGPLFAKFVVYRSDQGWILTSFNFNTKDDAIFSKLP